MAATTGKKVCTDCYKKCGKGRLTKEQIVKLEEAFKTVRTMTSNSLLKKYLTPAVYNEIKDIATPLGSSLLDCIQSGVANPDSHIGVYAADADAYEAFADLFDPIIEEYHKGFNKSDKHPPANWGNPQDLGNLDPDNKFVLSTRVRCGRSVEGFPFNPCLTEHQYKELENKIVNALTKFQGELTGCYYPLKGMNKDIQQQLIDDHFLFKEGDRFLEAANSNRFWPIGRGIFYNDAKTFLVWVNEEDHMRIISMQKGGDLGKVYQRLVSAVYELEKNLKFAHSPRLGYLTFCPTNLGTTVRASVHVKLPKLASDLSKLEQIAEGFNLQVRGTSGEHTVSSDGVYDISNKRRLGLTEFEALTEMNDGIKAMIQMEQDMVL